jgi:dihydroorotase
VTVIDPAQRLNAPLDVRITGAREVAVAERLAPGLDEPVVDARGLLVVPGLIDIHVHVFPGASHYGIAPDPHCLGTGVTSSGRRGHAPRSRDRSDRSHKETS